MSRSGLRVPGRSLRAGVGLLAVFVLACQPAAPASSPGGSAPADQSPGAGSPAAGSPEAGVLSVYGVFATQIQEPWDGVIHRAL